MPRYGLDSVEIGKIAYEARFRHQRLAAAKSVGCERVELTAAPPRPVPQMRYRYDASRATGSESW